jgi:hypothetical protein
MSTFTLLPDITLPTPEPTAHQLRLVTTGLAPTAEVPGRTRTKDTAPPAYGPCPTCGVPVVVGRTPTGIPVALETNVATYIVDFPPGAAYPLLQQSRAYPVHQCQQGVIEQEVAAQTTVLKDEVRDAWAAFHNAAETLRETEAENAKLRERNTRLDDADLRLTAILRETEAENTKLRERNDHLANAELRCLGCMIELE